MGCSVFAQTCADVGKLQPHSPGCLQVCRVASAWPPPPISFRNAWVQDLRVQLPTVTAAIDDAHLAFLERLQQLLRAASGGACSAKCPALVRFIWCRGAAPLCEAFAAHSPTEPAGGGTSAPGTSQAQQGAPQDAAGAREPAGGWGQVVPTPSRLLEHARNNAELSQALDRLGSDMRQAASPAPSSSPSRQEHEALTPGDCPLASTGSSASPGTQRQGRLGNVSAPAPAADMSPAGQLQAELLAEALGASASRLLIRHAHISRVQLLVDLHITRGAMALDTHRSGRQRLPSASSRAPLWLTRVCILCILNQLSRPAGSGHLGVPYNKLRLPPAGPDLLTICGIAHEEPLLYGRTYRALTAEC